MGRLDMGRIALKQIILSVWIASCGVTMLQAAHAQPPLHRITNVIGHAARANGETAAPAMAGKLDLRLPQEIKLGGDFTLTPLTAQPNSLPFARAESTHIMSPMETLVHNFHREGLPVARLFQNNESLVHIGLNPKGKPGLWLVHKLH